MKPSPVLEYMVICGGAQRCGIGADGRCIIRVHLQTFSDVFRHLSLWLSELYINIRLLVVPKFGTLLYQGAGKAYISTLEQTLDPGSFSLPTNFCNQKKNPPPTETVRIEDTAKKSIHPIRKKKTPM